MLIQFVLRVKKYYYKLSVVIMNNVNIKLNDKIIFSTLHNIFFYTF